MPEDKQKSEQDQQSSDGLHLEPSEYEKLGRAIEEVVISGYVGKRRLFFVNILRGVAFGLGSALGATALLVVIIYSLSLFSEVPFIGRLAESLQQTIEQNTAR